MALLDAWSLPIIPVWEVEAGGAGIQGHPQLCSEVRIIQATQALETLSQNKNKTKPRKKMATPKKNPKNKKTSSLVSFVSSPKRHQIPWQKGQNLQKFPRNLVLARMCSHEYVLCVNIYHSLSEPVCLYAYIYVQVFACVSVCVRA